MGHTFLSDSWFDETEKIRAELEPPVPDAVKDLVINLVVKDGPDGDVEAKLEAGRFIKGQASDAPTKLTLGYDLARKMFIEQDQQASMQAFMSGQIQVEGDKTKRMAMQAGGAPSDEAQQLQVRIQEMTE
jgi:putative sterol carrier protein